MCCRHTCTGLATGIALPSAREFCTERIVLSDVCWQHSPMSSGKLSVQTRAAPETTDAYRVPMTALWRTSPSLLRRVAAPRAALPCHLRPTNCGRHYTISGPLGVICAREPGENFAWGLLVNLCTSINRDAPKNVSNHIEHWSALSCHQQQPRPWSHLIDHPRSQFPRTLYCLMSAATTSILFAPSTVAAVAHMLLAAVAAAASTVLHSSDQNIDSPLARRCQLLLHRLPLFSAITASIP